MVGRMSCDRNKCTLNEYNGIGCEECGEWNMTVWTPNDKPVEYAQVKHGRWVHKYGDGHEEPAITGGECSICGYIHTATNYCPNCGARMDGVEE